MKTKNRIIKLMVYFLFHEKIFFICLQKRYSFAEATTCEISFLKLKMSRLF